MNSFCSCFPISGLGSLSIFPKAQRAAAADKSRADAEAQALAEKIKAPSWLRQTRAKPRAQHRKPKLLSFPPKRKASPSEVLEGSARAKTDELQELASKTEQEKAFCRMLLRLILRA